MKKRAGRKEQMRLMEEKRVLVIGSGLSGAGSVHLLHRVGALPVLLEQNEKRTEEEVREHLHPADKGKTKVLIGEIGRDTALSFDLVVPSPAVPLDTPFIRQFAEADIPVISEIELAYRFMQGALVAITGTNGKTTTTTLTGEILKARPAYHYGREVFVVGNIGDPFTGHTLDTKKKSVTVAEISSFQLEAVDEFHADVSCILNITPDHLDRHKDMETYVSCKERITNRQSTKEQDFCVLNYGDPYTRRFGESDCKAQVIWFSSGEKPPQGLWLNGDEITVTGLGEEDRVLMRFSECHLVGVCNAENVMASLGILIALGHEPFSAVEVIRAFHPVPHRIEYIATKNGVLYYNDSKATNPDAAIQGIRAMDRPTVLIGGGYDKGADYGDWLRACEGRVKTLVLTGQTKETIAESAKKSNIKDIRLTNDFDEALRTARACAGEGDAVLLSPACASWDMFRSYEERGDRFRTFVNELPEEGKEPAA